MHQNAFNDWAPPGPAKRAYSAPPRLPSWIKGGTRRKERTGKEGVEGKGRRKGIEEKRRKTHASLKPPLRNPAFANGLLVSVRCIFHPITKK